MHSVLRVIPIVVLTTKFRIRNTNTAENTGSDMEFWTICRDRDDIAKEKKSTNDPDEGFPGGEDNGEDYEDEDDDVDDEDEEEFALYGDESESEDGKATGDVTKRKSICGAKNCVCKRPPSENPDHKWILSKEGYLLFARLQYQTAIRNQDEVGQHFYNDFNGYGIQEVIENQVKSHHPADLFLDLTIPLSAAILQPRVHQGSEAL